MRISFVVINGGLALMVFMAGCSNELPKKVADLEAKLKASEAARETSQEAIKMQEESSRVLQAKIQQLTGVLTNSTAQLKEARDRIVAYEMLEQSRIAQEKAQKELAQQPKIIVPPPVIVQTNVYGVLEKRTVFPLLLGRTGEVIATNVYFSAVYGRRVFFVFEDNKRNGFDVDVLHPEILAALGIDAESAKKQQAQKDQQSRVFWQQQGAYMQQEAAENQRKAEERRVAAAKAAEIQARLAEQQRQQQFKEWVQIQAIQNDRIRANAAMQAADAAIIDATSPKPLPVIVTPVPIRRY